VIPLLQGYILLDRKPEVFTSFLDENLSLKIDQRGGEGGRWLSAVRRLRKGDKKKGEKDEEEDFLEHGRLASSFSWDDQIADFGEVNV
jgi:hypothetical protein